MSRENDLIRKFTSRRICRNIIVQYHFLKVTEYKFFFYLYDRLCVLLSSDTKHRHRSLSIRPEKMKSIRAINKIIDIKKYSRRFISFCLPPNIFSKNHHNIGSRYRYYFS